MPTPSSTPNKRIFNYACWLLARRRYGIKEFQGKLNKKFPEQPEATALIIELFIARKYLDDHEYARLYIQDQIRRKPQGLRMVKQKLRQKGIAETTFNSALQSLTQGDQTSSLEPQIPNEDELIQQAISKKSRTLKTTSPLQQKQKLYRFLVSRGFKQSSIMNALNNPVLGPDRNGISSTAPAPTSPPAPGPI